MSQSGRAVETEKTVIPGTQTLARGLLIIEAVAAGASDLRSITAFTKIGKSTVHRLVQLLLQERYLKESVAHEFALGPALIELGFRALESSELTTVASRYLESLSVRVHDTVHLAIEDEGNVLYLAKLPGDRGAEMRSRLGLRMPLTRTGLGMALLLDADESRWESLFLDERPVDERAVGGRVRTNVEEFVERMKEYSRLGVAFDLEDNEPGIRCVAAPVRDTTGEICAAISVAATRPYMPSERMKALSVTVRQAAASISEELGYRTSSRSTRN